MFGGMESSGMLQHMSVRDFAVQAGKGYFVDEHEDRCCLLHLSLGVGFEL